MHEHPREARRASARTSANCGYVVSTIARQFSRTDLSGLLGFISRNATAAPQPAYLMSSDIAWRLPGSAPKENLRLWYDDAGMAGYARFEPTTGAAIDIRADLTYAASVAGEMPTLAHSRCRQFAPAYPRFIDLAAVPA
jgi:hypothetical protein